MADTTKMANVVSILRKEMKKYEEPALTEISKDRNPFKVLISCILSLRTRDETTERVSRNLFSVADTPQKIANMPLSRLQKIIMPINYYKTKAKRIKEISRQLVKHYDSRVPNSMDGLLKFKGVGRKTANIVMVYGFEKPGIPVDVHVHVVANRLGWVRTKTPEKTEEELRKILPKRYWMELNDLFVVHGQNICQTRNPRCHICPVKRYCEYYEKYVK